MALFHFHVSQISRGHGQSAMASAAYRSGMRLHSDYYGETYDYTQKQGVLYTEILLPSHAPHTFSDRETLWNSLEQAEKHPKAQLAFSFDIALQNELSMEENISLARAFLLENFTIKGMISDLAVHLPDKKDSEHANPHFHVMCPIRPLTPDGQWGSKQRREYLIDDQGRRIPDGKGGFRFNAVPTTDWGNPVTLEHWRKSWADMVNARFKEKGLECRIDWRSFEESGIPLIPQSHQGPRVKHMEQKGIRTKKGELNLFIGQTNGMFKTLLRRLKELGEWMKGTKEALANEEIQHRTLADLVLEYYDHRDRVADGFERGRRKAKLTNLKKKAETIRYMQEKGIHSSSDLEHIITVLNKQASELEKSFDKLNSRVSLLKRHLLNAKAVDETREIYEKSRKIFFTGARKKYQTKHAKELKRYHAAMNYFTKYDISYEPDMKEEWENLTKKGEKTRDELFKEYEPIRAELKQLMDIKKAVDYSLPPEEQSNADTPAPSSIPEIGTHFPKNRESIRKKLETIKGQKEKKNEYDSNPRAIPAHDL